MDEQLDNDLKNRITEVFDNYEDPSADEGWLLLRKKFPEQEKKQQPAWLWWGSIAAAMLLFLGIGLWVANKNEQPQTFAVKPVKQQASPAQAADSLSVPKAPVTAPADAVIAPANTIAKNQPVKTTIAPVKSQPAAQQPVSITPDNQPTTYTAATTAQQPPINIKPAQTVIPVKPIDSVKNSIAKPNTQQYAVTTTPPPEVKNGASSIMFNNTPNANNTTAQTQQLAKTNKPAVSGMDALLARESKQAKKEDKTKEDFSTDKKVRFSVYAATFFNYAKGSNNQVNAGAGFTSDIKLSKNLRLSTGVALAQNTLSYNSTPPQAGVATALALNSYDAKNALVAAGIPLLKNYSANLVGIDIPVNLKYEFNPQKSDTYVSAGLSSGTFINEAYTAHYTYPGSAALSGTSDKSTDEVTRNNFNGFYLAKTLNVAFGVGYPVGKTNKLIIEPFLKYPLDGLGAQQLKFGAGGINLKFNFTGVK